MKKIKLTLVFLVYFSILSFGQQKYIITPVVASLISADNVSAGFMVSLKSGRIIHFFRLDPGATGNHTGNNGRPTIAEERQGNTHNRKQPNGHTYIY